MSTDSQGAVPGAGALLDRASRSGLLDDPAIARARAQGPSSDAVELARWLVSERLLTSYQARKLLAGATRGFFLGPWRIESELGKGGSGRVYRASHREDGRLAALKVLPPRDPEAVAVGAERFRREFELTRRLNHPRFAQAYEFGREDDTHYLAMELLIGPSLDRAITAEKPWSPLPAARYFAEVLDGLAILHTTGIVHRDIKPGNLIATPQGSARILDLGSALVLKEKPPVRPEGAIVGTLDYISPEQLDFPDRVDPRADLYSLGCTLYFALSGRAPFEGGDAVNTIYRHRLEDPPPLPRVPDDLAAIIRKAMAKDPDRRYDSCGAMQTALNQWRRRARGRGFDSTQ